MKNDKNKAADDYSTSELEKIELEDERKKAEKGRKKAEKESLIDPLTGLKHIKALKMEAVKKLSDVIAQKSGLHIYNDRY